MTIPRSERWPRDDFARSVWDSDQLKPLERLVALCFADHAREHDWAFVTYPRLMACTGLSRDSAVRAVKGLRDKGWLEVKEASRQQRATRYWLRCPAQPSASQTAAQAQGSVSQTAEPLSGTGDGRLTRPSSPSPVTSSLSPVTSSPGDRPDSSSDHSTDTLSDDPAQPSVHEHASAIADLLARHGNHLGEEHAVAAVEAIDADRKRKGKPIDDMAAYLAKFPLEDLLRWAGAPTTAPGPRTRAHARCPHGKPGGMVVRGTGEDASRVCGSCETEAPAAAPTPLDAVHARDLAAPSAARTEVSA